MQQADQKTLRYTRIISYIRLGFNRSLTGVYCIYIFHYNPSLDATDLLSCCCVYLLLVSHHEDNPTRIANHGLIPHVLKIVSHNSENTVCISLVCSLLWSLTVIPDSLRAMTEVR